MKPSTKIGLIAVGCMIAAAVAAVAVACHLVAIGGPARQAYSGMNVFGEGLLFLAVFGVASIPATGAGFFFLRPYPAFWRVFAAVALLVACTGLAALVAVAIDVRSMAAGVAFLRILVAPVFALTFGVAGCFAPNRFARLSLFAATAIELAGFAGWVISCLVRNS
jgi:hypothetical protein